MSLAKLLNQLGEPDTDPVGMLVLVVDWLRPAGHEDATAAATRMAQLEAALTENLDLHQSVSERLQHWLEQARFFQLLAGLGLFSRRGFLREFSERLYERINPAPPDPDSVKDVVFIVFHHPGDRQWVAQVSDDAWLRLLKTLWRFSPREVEEVRLKVCREILYAIELLSIWIAAEELEPDILRLDPRIVQRDSALVALQRELAQYARDYPRWLQGELETFHDDAHARVLLEQCEEEIARLRRRAVLYGTSVALTHLLERLSQTLTRIEHLLDILDPADANKRRDRSLALFKQLVGASAARHSVGALVQQNIKLVARSVTENSSDRGDHYIAGSRRAYFHMLASGAGGGFIIAFMALMKIQILNLGQERFTETLLVSLNYGLGFVIIHMLHCTVATKQPAMTAASIAEKVEQGEQGRANARKLAELLVRVGRTQFVAILGNVSVALSVAFAVGWVYSLTHGSALISEARHDYILHGIQPFGSLALFYAAIAGVWLFLSGLIAGFFDNRAAYLGLEARLREHPLLRRLLPTGLRHRFAAYVDEHYGALISNFAFGIMLGSTGYLGYLLGLPVDIRHVAFSSADLGYALSASGPGAGLVISGIGFVLLIGAVNLAVSFTLALNVALRARGTRIASLPKLLRAYGQVLRERPAGFLFPPRDLPEAGAQDDKAKSGESGKGTPPASRETL